MSGGGSDKGDAGGLGLALGFVAAAGLTLWVPGYLEATDGWRSAWLTVGGVLALIGVGGAATELGRLSGRDGWGEISAGLVVAGMAGVLHVVQATLVIGRLASGLKFAVVVLVLFAPTGVGMGIARALHGGKGGGIDSSKVIPLVTALLGVAAALLNFVRAAAP